LLLLAAVQLMAAVMAELEYDFTPEAKADLVKELPGLWNPGKRRMYS